MGGDLVEGAWLVISRRRDQWRALASGLVEFWKALSGLFVAGSPRYPKSSLIEGGLLHLTPREQEKLMIFVALNWRRSGARAA